jgi:hypothetical protein
MPLDSDYNNADNQLHVEFYTNSRDKEYMGKPFVRIMVPGDKTTIIDQPVQDHHKERFPRQWLHFQMQNNDAPVIGTPVEVWAAEAPDEISELQLGELQILKFRVVEQVATATDSQLQRIGMGGLSLRNKAQAFLRQRNAVAATSELAETRRELAEMREQMAAFLAGQGAEKRGPGRPPKNAEAE